MKELLKTIFVEILTYILVGLFYILIFLEGIFYLFSDKILYFLKNRFYYAT
jgi:uncharacterized iron-regulated membrane protein